MLTTYPLVPPTTLSDSNPAALGTAAPGVATDVSRSDHVHPPSLSDANPAAVGTASAGVSTSWSRADHVHPGVTTTRGDLIRRGATIDERFALGSLGYYLRAGATDPAWSQLLASDLVGLCQTIPLFPYTTSTSAVPTVVGLAGVTPSDYTISGRTTALTLDAIGSVTSVSQTGTLEVLNAAGTTVASLTWTETTPTRKTASITLPGSSEIYRARVSCAGVVSPLTDYTLIGGAHIRLTWS